MSKALLTNWLRTQQTTLEKILLESAQEYYSKHSELSYFGFDAKETGADLWLLGKGKDLCYDRPTIGFNYAMWYHPKRINTFLRYFTDLLYDSRFEEEINVFDLGAGTGAVQWAVGLIIQGLKSLDLPCPNTRVISVDTSAFMLIYNYNYLWKHFAEKYPEAASISDKGDYKLNSWSSLEEKKLSNVWLCASYLFDHTENETAIANDFRAIITEYQPKKIILLTSSQSRKIAFCNSVADSILQLGYSNATTPSTSQIFTGALHNLTEFRNEISSSHNLNLSGLVKWDIDSLYGKVVVSNNVQRALDFDSLNIFIQPEKDRAKIKMTKQQSDAANIYAQPTLIIGPAGCGKSVVLTQKILNILNETKTEDGYNTNSKILVTTFNKSLVKYLGDWIEQLLEAGTFRRDFNRYGTRQSEYSYFRFNGSPTWNIYVMHFDVLPTKIGSVHAHDVTTGAVNYEEFHLQVMRKAVDSYVAKSLIDTERYFKILDPDFLLEEYHRVVYGSLCNNYSASNHELVCYCDLPRDGRGNDPQLKFKTQRRKIVWDIINTYLHDLRCENVESFIVRRHRFIKQLLRNNYPNKFTHVIVDEFQDCTKADYEIFYNLLSDPNELTLAGDIAQSINLGAALHIPKEDGQLKFKKLKLEGSFRLPFRVSECIKPLSESIGKKFGKREGIEVGVINPYKGAPPGSRPILVFASDTEEASNKVSEIFRAYHKALKLDKITIFEKDTELCNALNYKDINSETEIILRTKGLEKRCVLWSTRTNIDTIKEKEEFVYTILTRTVSLLIILLFADAQQEYKEIIKMLVPDRLILWNRDTEDYYKALMQSGIQSEEQPDEDDSEVYNNEDDQNIDEVI